MNVLTIDLDYMSTNYAKLVDNIYSNDFSNKRCCYIQWENSTRILTTLRIISK